MKSNEAAIQAVDAEWDKLRKKTYTITVNGKEIERVGTWNEDVVREFNELKGEVNKKGNNPSWPRV